MSEVGRTSAVTVQVAAPASSKGAGNMNKVVQGGKDMPLPSTTAASEATRAVTQSAEQLDQAVARMNEYIQSEQRDLQFSVDEASGQTIVRVTDRETGDLIRQIPNEVFLTLAEQARKNEAIHLISANG